MPRKNTDVGRRAWNLVRLAIVWARKGGVFKPRILIDLPKFMIKSLRHSAPRGAHAQLHYGDHELSFDETPLFHRKMHRPRDQCHAPMRFHFPCITSTRSTPPQADFEYEFDHCDGDGDGDGDSSSDVCSYDGERRSSGYDGEEDELEVDGIDLRAEKFIAEFYDQMKMQRQTSFSQRRPKSF